MSVNPSTKYPGRITAPSVDYPYGKAQNITVPGDGTGTPWEKDILNDIFGFQQALLSDAAEVPSGVPDKVGASQYLKVLFKRSGLVRDDYADLRVTKSNELLDKTQCFITGSGIGGAFVLDKTDITSSDDSALIIVDTDGGRWIRLYFGSMHPEWFEVIGDGVVDDTANMFRCLDRDNSVIEFNPEATYRVAGLTAGTDHKGEAITASLLIADRVGVTIKGNGATIISDEVPVAANEAGILCFYSDIAFADSNNIKVENVILDYATTPTSRINNNFPLLFSGIEHYEAIGCEVLSSWSAAMWSKMCSHGLFQKNKIISAKADGITFSGCGRNIKVLENEIDNIGDDGIAITWFAGNLPADVGETEAYTFDSEISGNIINGSPDSGRGVFLGGLKSSIVSVNRISNTGKYGISTNSDTRDLGSPFYDVSGVATESHDILITDNILNSCGLNSNDTAFFEIGGIAIQHQCTGIVVDDNELNNCNNVAILSPGNADIINNKINGVVFSNTGTVNDSDLIYKGMGISVGDFSATDLCTGTIKGNNINNVLSRAVWIRLSADDGWHVGKNTLTNCGNVTNTSDTMTINGLIYIDNATDCTIESNVHVDNRASNTIPALVYQGSGGNTVQRNNFPSRIARTAGMVSFLLASGGAYYYREVAVDPASIATLGFLTGTTTVNGALIGDAVTVSPSLDLAGLLLSSVVVAANTVKWTLYNPTGGAVDLASSTWVFRIHT